MEKLNLEHLKTRGDLRRVSERSLQGSELTNENDLSVSPGSPLWDLWRYFCEFYGAAFSSQYGDEPNATWAHALRDLTPADYRRGIELLHTRASAFAPNPAEFVELVGTDSSWERQCHRIDDTPALEDKTGNERRCAVGVERIRQLRQEVGL